MVEYVTPANRYIYTASTTCATHPPFGKLFNKI